MERGDQQDELKTGDAEWEEEYNEGGWEDDPTDNGMKDTVFNQMNFELEKVMKEAEDLLPQCKLPKVPKSADLEKMMQTLYPPSKGGFTASHCLAGYDR